MSRGALRFTEDQYRAHAAKSDRFKVGTVNRPAADTPAAPPPASGGASYSVQAPSGGPMLENRVGAYGGSKHAYAVSQWCDWCGLPEPEFEFRFHPHRKWRFDCAWPHKLVALEVEGGIWTQGRHTRGAGFLADMEKYNAAVLLGWRVLRTTPDKLADGVKSVRLLMLA